MKAFQRTFILCAVIFQVFGSPTSNDSQGGSGVIANIDFPAFPASDRLSKMAIEKRSSKPFTSCDWTYGVAYTKITREENIDRRLEDVKNLMCIASPNTCTRVAYLNQSGIFLCNNHPDHIITECKNLIDPAKKLSAACNYGNHYTFGVLDGKIQNGTQQVAYHLRIAAEGW